MSYTVVFEGTKAEQEKAAMKEVMLYLGRARYLQVRRRLVEATTDVRRSTIYRSVRLGCWLVGVQGYFPVRAVARDVLRIHAARARDGR
jgi:hypothetical protein